MEEREALGKNLKRHRQFKGLTQEDLATKKVKEDLLKRHFRRLMCIWEHDRKRRLMESKKITEEEQAYVEDFLFWLQEQNCRIQEPDHFVAKIEYYKVCWAMVGRGEEKAG